ncbi:helix-turn-helix domain-containing protein [Agromyces sp. NPDC058484]|uniref:helix-turn-helix domain-containing protein n=1 Tax=Agromyces sp. NPDC058484 TaxID=3346524 RepID=UPI00364A5784
MTKLERTCTVEREMKKAYDATVCRALKLRIGELRAAENVDDLLLGTGRWERLVGDRAGQWSARLTKNRRLVVHEETTTEVMIIELVDYHQVQEKTMSSEPDYVVSTGDHLAEWMDDNDVIAAELARRLGTSRKHVSELLNGRAPLTRGTAISLEEVTGIRARIWNQ